MLRVQVRGEKTHDGKQDVEEIVGEYDAMFCACIKLDKNGPRAKAKVERISAADGVNSRALAFVMAMAFADGIAETFKGQPARMLQAGQTVWDKLKEAALNMPRTEQEEMREVE